MGAFESGRGRLRRFILAWAVLTGCYAVAPSVARAAADIPYYKLDYRRYDDSYPAEDAKARRFAEFRWDGQRYCRYPSGWIGPGAYRVGDRYRRGYGWDAGYPWQGPGTEADHGDAQDFADYAASYAREFRRGPFCATYRHRRYRGHPVVLRRKD